ncbi:MAG: DUF3179 domain-containing (seleno)protein [Pseudomonadota bacterium]|nr:DUF3179 domain-containing (seleno)protein [Pseudomonadota bacterium]
MWDRRTESWWQQFLSEAIAGSMTGTKLKALPARLESWANYKKRFRASEVLSPDGRFASMETLLQPLWRLRHTGKSLPAFLERRYAQGHSSHAAGRLA